MKKYYEINEELARKSKQLCSFDDYVEGSATKEYREMVDYAYELTNEVLEENKEKALYYADMYAKKLAENMNKRFNIDISCPSIMIAGASKFPTRKKEKQTERRDKAFKEYKAIKHYLAKIENLKYNKTKREKQGVAKNDIDLTNDFFEVVQNEEMNRLQLVFEAKPDEEQRTLLKKKGFRWSPKNKVWQRQLTNNALFATKLLIEMFDKMLANSKD